MRLLDEGLHFIRRTLLPSKRVGAQVTTPRSILEVALGITQISLLEVVLATTVKSILEVALDTTLK